MKAMVLNTYGADARFQSAELPTPSAGPGQVLIRVAATSVNTVDTKIQTLGDQLAFAPALPAVLGMDVAGTIEGVGEGVSGFALGDEVYGCAGGLGDLQGALATYMTADARLIAHKPKNLSMQQAAALPLVAITAFEGLQRARTHAGQKVLVHGGTGGVGHVTVQLAKHLGADVYATCSSNKQMGIIQGYGATAINYKTESVADYVAKHTAGAGFDVVFDSVGGENLTKSFEAAALNAQIATTVSMVTLDLMPAHVKGLSLHVVFMLIQMLHNHKREEHGAMLATLAGIAEAGALVPLLDEVEFTLDQANEAYERLRSGQAIGKVVISVPAHEAQ